MCTKTDKMLDRNRYRSAVVRPGNNRNSMNCDTMSAPPPAPPPSSSDPQGQTRGCEQLCREASRSAAGCVAVVLLALGYAAVGGALFMAIETRAANMIREAIQNFNCVSVDYRVRYEFFSKVA